MKPLVVKGMVASCMDELLKCGNASVRIFKSPEAAVFSTKAYEANTLIIAPVTLHLNEAKDSDANKTIATCDGYKYKLEKLKDAKCMSTFWFLEVNKDRSKCNLEIIDKTMFAKRPSQKSPNNNAIVQVVFPIACNFKPIADRERLTLYRPMVIEAAKRKEGPLKLAQTNPKKQK